MPSWMIDKKQLCPTCMQGIRAYCSPCYNKGKNASQTYAQFVWKKAGDDGEVVMTDILGMVMSMQPLVRVSDDGRSAEFMNADGDVVMTATNTEQEATDVAGEQDNDES
jgi:hypothetical protein